MKCLWLGVLGTWFNTRLFLNLCRMRAHKLYVPIGSVPSTMFQFRFGGRFHRFTLRAADTDKCMVKINNINMVSMWNWSMEETTWKVIHVRKFHLFAIPCPRFSDVDMEFQHGNFYVNTTYFLPRSNSASNTVFFVPCFLPVTNFT